MNRNENLSKLNEVSKWDFVVIGGGATGLGIAVDAASRGFKALVLEKFDLAKGTSSKSTKLLHGGVRYLANGDVKLVYSALKERGLVFKNAPHVSFVQSFVIPCYSIIEKLKYGIGLKLYDWMAGKLRIGKSVILNKKSVQERIPKVKTTGLKGGVLYFDGQFDDARLAINLAQTATDYGAVVINYAEVTGFDKDDGGIVAGVKFLDKETGDVIHVGAKAVINATGVFVDDILQLDRSNHRNLVRPSQGSHIVVDRAFLGGTDALMIPSTSDGRVLFGVPWHGKAVLGTTDIPLEKHEIEPLPMEQEIEFILSTAQQYLDHAPARTDILSVFSGLRPLAAPTSDNDGATKEISRDHKLIISDSKLVTITGGKWTTYRKMAEETVDFAIRHRNLSQSPCKTHALKIHGYSLEQAKDHFGIYGSDGKRIKALAEQYPPLREKIVPGFDHIAAEVVWACENEMARTVEDFLARRTRVLLLHAAAAVEAAPKVAQIMADCLDKDQRWIENQIASFSKLAENYLPAKDKRFSISK